MRRFTAVLAVTLAAAGIAATHAEPPPAIPSLGAPQGWCGVPNVGPVAGQLQQIFAGGNVLAFVAPCGYVKVGALTTVPDVWGAWTLVPAAIPEGMMRADFLKQLSDEVSGPNFARQTQTAGATFNFVKPLDVDANGVYAKTEAVIGNMPMTGIAGATLANRQFIVLTLYKTPVNSVQLLPLVKQSLAAVQ